MFKKVLYEYKKRNVIKGSETGDNYKIVKTSFIVDTTQFIICLKSQKIRVLMKNINSVKLDLPRIFNAYFNFIYVFFQYLVP